MNEESVREVMTRYVESGHEDTSMMAPDVVFRDMNSGQEHRGPDGVRAMLDYVYHQAFDARAEDTRLMVAGDRAVLEGTFVGRHVGEFAGVPATGREVRVPLCVTYELRDDRIVEAHVYMAVGAMMAQLTRDAPDAEPMRAPAAMPIERAEGEGLDA